MKAAPPQAGERTPANSSPPAGEGRAGARDGEAGLADYLLSAAAVRERCGIVFAAAERDDTRHFRLNLDRLDAAAELVAAVTRRRYPDLDVPPHSRWRHFATGGIDRAALVAPGLGPAERARAGIDLTIVSVLLDAGAGPVWRYRESATGLVLARSEGLAAASLRAMQAGLFSADPRREWRADAVALAAVTADRLADALQHRPGNPLFGLEGRAALLRRLGERIAVQPAIFGTPARLGNLYDYWLCGSRRPDATIDAPEMLRLILRAFGPIWPGRLALGGVPLGDCGRHGAVPGDGLVPFHKLSQWLVYSLIEPLADSGLQITGIDALTGLAEYRNGGLFIDAGILVPRDPDISRRPLDPFGEPVVEWRALTVALLDRLAERVRDRLGLDAAAFPLPKLLEGGSWTAGRELAAECRPDGTPPLAVESDGTLF